MGGTVSIRGRCRGAQRHGVLSQSDIRHRDFSAVQRALELRPEVCFLDIRMPGASGLKAAQALAEDWPEATPFPLLVFVTAYDQYALQAFEAQAVDYLVKPVDGARLAACVERLRARLAERSAAGPMSQTLEQLRALLAGGDGARSAAPRLEIIQASIGNTVHMVPVDEVVYLEAADKYVRVVTAQHEHLVRVSLKELLPRLDHSQGLPSRSRPSWPWLV